MKNGDAIRAMTDEELAKKISGIESFALTCGGGWPPENWLNWLKQEADENHAPTCKSCGGTLSEIRYHNGRPYRHCFSCHFEFYEEEEDGKAD